MAEKITLYGVDWCPDCKRMKKIMGEHQIPYRWIDTDHDSEARSYVERINGGAYRVPTLTLSDGTVLVEPSNAELKVKLGITGRASKPIYDVIIIGGDPAGLTAAIYTGRDNYDTLIIDRTGLGGQAGLTQVIENFPGFDKGVTGADFAERLSEQAQRFGTEPLQGEEISNIHREGQYIVVTSVNKREYIGRSVLISTGSHFKQLNVPGEMELAGIRVHYCATCDGPFYKGKSLMVIGGGNSGFEEGLFLSTFAKDVTIIEHNPEVKASEILQDKVDKKKNMKVFTNRDVKEFKVDGTSLSSVLVEKRDTGEIEEWNPEGVFVFIGLKPNSAFLRDTVECDKWGFVKTDLTFQTSLEGVFAAGDVRSGSTKQAVSAAGEGTTAALMIRQYLQSIGEARKMHSIERELSPVM
jgi:thioredoxin reductase (NADPH)